MRWKNPSTIHNFCFLIICTFCSGGCEVFVELIQDPIDSALNSPRSSNRVVQTEEERTRNAAARAEMEKTVAPDRLKAAQRMLNSLGYECGEPTGVVDGRTRTAVIDYQFDQGLEITGWINDSLVRHLETRVADL